MVFDDLRNTLYAKAIRNYVTPDSVVLDLGAGLGVHGLAAAAAGARRIYMVEPEPVAQVAKEIASVNGLADRIVVIEDAIENAKLPEQVDLIVSTSTGNLLFSEDLLPSLFFARDKHLKLGGGLIPDMAELLLAPISMPEIHAKHIGLWSVPNQGMDYSPARRFAANELLWLGRQESNAERLAAGVVLSSVDLKTAQNADCSGEAVCLIEKSGICHGLLGWVRIHLGDQWLSSDPAEPEVHWSPAILPIDQPLNLEEGEQITLALIRPAFGDWAWSISAKAGIRRQSTALGELGILRRLKLTAPDACPGLDQLGEDSLLVLEMMHEGQNIRNMADVLLKNRPSSYPNTEAAIRFVQGVVLRYGR